jgi:DNA-binding IclR family transcriptional regulator
MPPRNDDPVRAPVLRDVPAVSRAIAILRLLADSTTPLGVQAVAQALGLVPSTCLHILRVLTAEGLVAVDETNKRYRLGGGLIEMARGASQAAAFPELARPHLEQVAARHEATALAVSPMDLDHMVVVAIAQASGLSLHADIGSRFPTLISATGRCVAAFCDIPLKDLRRRFRSLRWANPPTFEEWLEEVEATRRMGFAVDRSRYMEGVTIVAAPVYSRAPLVSALVVVALNERIRKIGVEEVGADLHTRAAELSRRLGGAPAATFQATPANNGVALAPYARGKAKATERK